MTEQIETPLTQVPETVEALRRGPPKPPDPRELWPPPPPPDREGLNRILFGSDHDNLAEAVAADIIDILPIIGDVSNAYRVADAAKKKQARTPKVNLQLIDLALGVLPEPVGEILDVLTPSSTVNFLRKRPEE